MRVIKYSLLGGLFGGLSAPPIGIGNEEKLLFAEFGESRKVKVGLGLIMFLPGVERGSKTTRVSNIFA